VRYEVSRDLDDLVTHMVEVGPGDRFARPADVEDGLTAELKSIAPGFDAPQAAPTLRRLFPGGYASG